MPDTPGKRQRIAQKARRREIKAERRAARKAEGGYERMSHLDEAGTEGQHDADPRHGADGVDESRPSD